MIEHLNLTDDERVLSAWDAYLCQNLMAQFVTAQELGQEELQFERLWSNREDISFGDNQGFYVGRNSVREFWVTGRQKVRAADAALHAAVGGSGTPGAGAMERRNLMSPLIEVARDGQTAKGMWYCPGVGTQTEIDGNVHLRWHYIRYGADFVLEESSWKLWHVFEGSEFAFEMGHSYIPGTGMNPLPDTTVYSQHPETEGMPLGREVLPDRDIQMETYSIRYGWSPFPAVPVPYDTFANTFSYGPEPWLAMQEVEK